MQLAKVIGQVVATQKHAKFQGMKLLLVQPHVAKDGAFAASGPSVVAVDSVDPIKETVELRRYTPVYCSQKKTGAECGRPVHVGGVHLEEADGLLAGGFAGFLQQEVPERVAGIASFHSRGYNLVRAPHPERFNGNPS